MIFPKLQENIQKAIQNISVSDDHKETLEQIRYYIQDKHSKAQTTKLVFICTHNSRRSHIGQCVAYACSVFFGVNNIEFYSGGTEATAFHPNAIRALRQFGFQIQQLEQSSNPKYEIKIGDEYPSLIAFSKVYTHTENPKDGFAAIMVCDDAAENCPVVYGAEKRFKLTYTDPKVFDNTSSEEEKYYEKVIEILNDMIYLFLPLKKANI